MQPDLFAASEWDEYAEGPLAGPWDGLDDLDDVDDLMDDMGEVLGGREEDLAPGTRRRPGAAPAGPGEEDPPIEVRRSARRTRTVTAFRENGAIVVAIPARMTRTEERHWVEVMVGRVLAAEAKRGLSDADLERLAGELTRRYVPGAPLPNRITWSTRQMKRWGSCSIQQRTIRISDRLKDMPPYVRDYVIVHELTHLVHRNHGREFKAVMAGYPHSERADAFLAGVTFAEYAARA